MSQARSSTAGNLTVKKSIVETVIYFREVFRNVSSKDYADLLSDVNDRCQRALELAGTPETVGLILEATRSDFRELSKKQIISNEQERIYQWAISLLGIIFYVSKVLKNSDENTKTSVLSILTQAKEKIADPTRFKKSLYALHNDIFSKYADSSLRKQTIAFELNAKLNQLSEDCQQPFLILDQEYCVNLGEKNYNVFNLRHEYEDLLVEARKLLIENYCDLTQSTLLAFAAKKDMLDKKILDVISKTDVDSKFIKANIIERFNSLFNHFDESVSALKNQYLLDLQRVESEIKLEDLTQLKFEIDKLMLVPEVRDVSDLSHLVDVFFEISVFKDKDAAKRQDLHVTGMVSAIHQLMEQLSVSDRLMHDIQSLLLDPERGVENQFLAVKESIKAKIDRYDDSQFLNYYMNQVIKDDDGSDVNISRDVDVLKDFFEKKISFLENLRRSILDVKKDAVTYLEGFVYDPKASIEAISACSLNKPYDDIIAIEKDIRETMKHYQLYKANLFPILGIEQLEKAEILLKNIQEKAIQLDSKHKAFSKSFYQKVMASGVSVRVTPAEQVYLHIHQCDLYLAYASNEIQQMTDGDIQELARAAYDKLGSGSETKLSKLLVKYAIMSEAKEKLLQDFVEPVDKLIAFNQFWNKTPFGIKESHCQYISKRRDSGVKAFFKGLLTVVALGIPLLFLWKVKGEETMNGIFNISNRAAVRCRPDKRVARAEDGVVRCP